MTTRTKFTILWTGLTFMGLCVALSFLAPLILTGLGAMNDKTPLFVGMAYTLRPVVPLLAAGACLLLCVFGKLPGTKGTTAHSYS